MIIPIPASLPTAYDLIEFRQSNAVTDKHDSSEDTNHDREAHKTTNLLTDKNIKINQIPYSKMAAILIVYLCLLANYTVALVASFKGKYSFQFRF